MSINHNDSMNFLSCNVWSEAYRNYKPVCIDDRFLPITAKAEQTALDFFAACRGKAGGDLPHAMALQECTKSFGEALVDTLNKNLPPHGTAKYQLIHANHKLDYQTVNAKPNSADGVALVVLLDQNDRIADVRTAWFGSDKGKARASIVADIQYGRERFLGKCVRFGSFHANGNPNDTSIGDTQTQETLEFFERPEQFGTHQPIRSKPACVMFGTDLNQTPNGKRVALIQQKGFEVDIKGQPTERTQNGHEIDYIGCKSMDPTQTVCCRAVGDELHQVLPSDHLVVLSQIWMEAVASQAPHDMKHAVGSRQPVVQAQRQQLQPAPRPVSQTSNRYCAKAMVVMAVVVAALGFLASKVSR